VSSIKSLWVCYEALEHVQSPSTVVVAGWGLAADVVPRGVAWLTARPSNIPHPKDAH
jgi:hypothetical protein